MKNGPRQDSDTMYFVKFLASLIKSLPPLQDVAGMAGLELPKYLGEMTNKDKPESSN